MWNPQQKLTLARIVHHRRQFEGWWKFAVATSLWELADRKGLYVCVEALRRADVVLAHCSDDLSIDTTRSPCVPIELKTMGTFWGSRPSDIARAYSEARKKPLETDMMAAAQGLRREAKPFAAVALLVTHKGDLKEDRVFLDYLQYPRDLATRHALENVLDEEIPLPQEGSTKGAFAHQFLWVSKRAGAIDPT